MPWRQPGIHETKGPNLMAGILDRRRFIENRSVVLSDIAISLSRVSSPPHPKGLVRQRYPANWFGCCLHCIMVLVERIEWRTNSQTDEGLKVLSSHRATAQCVLHRREPRTSWISLPCRLRGLRKTALTMGGSSNTSRSL